MKTVKDCFIKNNAMQCGFCSSGMLMSTYEIIKLNKKITRSEIRNLYLVIIVVVPVIKQL